VLNKRVLGYANGNQIVASEIRFLNTNHGQVLNKRVLGYANGNQIVAAESTHIFYGYALDYINSRSDKTLSVVHEESFVIHSELIREAEVSGSYK
jgi:hypothetical protein